MKYSFPIFVGGEGVHLWFTASPLYGAESSVAGVIESVRDVTDRKKAENALKEKLNLLFSITRHGIIKQLSVIMVCEELLKDEIDKEKFRDFLKPMIGATEMIEHVIKFTGAWRARFQISA